MHVRKLDREARAREVNLFSGRLLRCSQTGEGHSNHICHIISLSLVSILVTSFTCRPVIFASQLLLSASSSLSGDGNGALWAVYSFRAALPYQHGIMRTFQAW
jgi:hypothetical protein